MLCVDGPSCNEILCSFDNSIFFIVLPRGQNMSISFLSHCTKLWKETEKKNLTSVNVVNAVASNHRSHSHRVDMPIFLQTKHEKNDPHVISAVALQHPLRKINALLCRTLHLLMPPMQQFIRNIWRRSLMFLSKIHSSLLQGRQSCNFSNEKKNSLEERHMNVHNAHNFKLCVKRVSFGCGCRINCKKTP